MKKYGYIGRQEEQDQEWIYDLTESLVDMWRRRHDDRPPKAIRHRLEQLAIDMHRIAWADDYFADEGLTQMRQEVVGDEAITAEKLNLWASEIRKYNESIERRLDKHSLLDPPEERAPAGLEAGETIESEHMTITIASSDAEQLEDAAAE